MRKRNKSLEKINQSLKVRVDEIEKKQEASTMADEANINISTGTPHNCTPSSDEYLLEAQEIQLQSTRKIDALYQKIYALEQELNVWKQEAQVEKANEIRNLLKRCKLLDEKNAELETMSMQIYQDQKNQALDPAGTGFRSIL